MGDRILKKRFTFCLLALFCAAAFISICTGAEVPEKDRIYIITRLTGRLISEQHYSQHPLNEVKSAMIFDEYFKMLDPNRMFFTEQDIQEFLPRRANLHKELAKGDSSFAYVVFEKFLKRFHEYCAFAEKELQKKVDFSTDETYTPDRRKLPRAADDRELHKLWQGRLKNDLLYHRLVKRALDLDAASLKAGDTKNKEELATRKLWEKRSPEEKILRRLRDLQNFYRQRDKIDILSGYLGAVAAAYGPHTGYLAPKQDEDFNIDMSLSLIGIGATLTSEDGYIRVVNIVPGGPADRDGRLHAEDRIIAVTQEKGEPVDVVDMSVDNAVKLIRGKEGTKVTLTILPGKKGRNAVPENITITREKVVLKDSEAKGTVREAIQPDGSKIKVGTIELPSFYMDFTAMFRGDPNYKSCSRDVKKILEDFRKQGVQTVVMDLRRNTGGSLPEAIMLTGLFIKTGPVVQVRAANRDPEVENDEDESIVWTGPLVVLTSKLSASAAEIFAAAIKDYRRGILVGDSRTYGKGTVLSVIQLEKMLGFINRKFPAGSVRLETAMFFRINGDSVQQLGVKPDIVLPSLTEPLEIGEMFSSNHLPWDSIPAQSYRIWDPDVDKLLPQIRQQSENRIRKDAEYGKLIKRKNRLQDQIAVKAVSLNEEKRWQEYLADRKVGLSEEKLQEEEMENALLSKKKTAQDPILKESENIAIDYYTLKKSLTPKRKEK
ncbi:MAG: carboxy terminal-processing peptidase [Lentisphaeria bacterium]|nr:carboxy terminal-processing peptidase [Lentisphaeria bacterium]MBQ7393884.1 carboxy terminal-processing peptidase [Lentisphaeria bacterium]